MPDAYVATDGLLRHSITSTRELFVHSHSRNGPCRVEVEPIFMQRSEFYNRYSSLRKWIVWMGMLIKQIECKKFNLKREWNGIWYTVIFFCYLQCRRQVFLDSSVFNWIIQRTFDRKKPHILLLIAVHSNWPTSPELWQEHVIISSCQGMKSANGKINIHIRVWWLSWFEDNISHCLVAL